MLRRAIIFMLATLAAYYVAEDLSLRYRIPRSREPFGKMTVYRYDAIQEKNGKVEFDAENPATVTCVHGLLPHMSYAPCWYLARHTEQRIDY